MLVSEIKKDLLIVNDQPDLMLAISQLDGEEGIAEVVWSMAVKQTMLVFSCLKTIKKSSWQQWITLLLQHIY